MAGIFDLLNAANWQRSGKGSRPKPIKRPASRDDEVHFGTPIPIEEAREKLKLRRLGVVA